MCIIKSDKYDICITNNDFTLIKNSRDFLIKIKEKMKDLDCRYIKREDNEKAIYINDIRDTIEFLEVLESIIS